MQHFQYAIFNKDDVRKLVNSVNNNAAQPLQPTDLNSNFEKKWKQLETNVAKEFINARAQKKPMCLTSECCPEHLIYFMNAERGWLTNRYIKESEAAQRIDIVSLTMGSILANYGEERWRKFLLGGKNMRILVLSPTSMAATMRGQQEGVNLVEKISFEILALENLYNRLRERRGEWSGSLEVRLYDSLPCFAYFGTERAVIAGLYYSHHMGLQSEAIFIDAKCPVYNKMQSHFNNLWENGNAPREKQDICVISNSRMYFRDPTAVSAFL